MGEQQSSLSAPRDAAAPPSPAGGPREDGTEEAPPLREAAGPGGSGEPPPSAGSERRGGGGDAAGEDEEEAAGLETSGVGESAEEEPELGGGRRRPARRHVYCTVYCVENDRPGPGSPPGPGSAQPPARRGVAAGGDPLSAGGSIEVVDLYLLPEPFSGLIGGDFGPLLVLSCRVCLEEKPVKPLSCCKKAVCEECLKRYLSSQIQCPSCQFVWCFKCHSPWHEGVNCKEYKKGDKLLRHWANEIEHGQRNAQKCPKCKIHIQRTEGCDHMTCSQCNTNFCYRCGERYRQLRFFGDHTSNLSIFGCKYRYLPERPHLRRLVRGSVCAGKLLITPLILILGLALGAVAVVVGLFVFPIYCLCKKQRKRSRTVSLFLVCKRSEANSNPWPLLLNFRVLLFVTGLLSQHITKRAM
ncbi:probable E3 ubiquitin-protein ligase RNF217 isoform X4 [Coturnix japonica]|uniref:probable E3 ubiquitin-protein ligase RNF217 isoform X4 n=1 Tax=Coturnix japonica TaxID=93934 RepID=UPI000777AE68|nr:probable E3 ubiquitin-protein ligase RNF217 isoform X4 [Coturnix japonica]